MNYNDEKYIKVSDLKEKYKWWCNTPSGQQEYKEICDCVDAIPAADVEKVRHGEWIRPNPYCKPFCSECKTFEQSGEKKKYCSECGAKMDGKDGKNNVACV